VGGVFRGLGVPMTGSVYLNATLTAEEQLHRIEIMDWNEFPVGITGKTLKRVFRLRTEAMHTS
jgi:hypothetical protein